MADVTLSSAVRNNLLSLQNTADLLGKTQERLATGLRVNSALDDPNAFFTASSLSSRAGDLNRLLDSVGLAVQTLSSADNAISSITKLVENAQATARQAQQSPEADATAASVEGTATIGADTVAIATGDIGAGTVELDVTGLNITDGDTLSITVGGTAYTVEFDSNGADAGTADLVFDYSSDETVDDLIAALDTLLDGDADVTDGTGDQIVITANDAADDIVLSGTAGLLADLDLDAVGTGPDADNRTVEPANTDLTALDGETLTITVGSGADLVITFGTDDSSDEVSTLAELAAALGDLEGGTATVTGGDLVITATSNADSITTLASDAAVNTAFGISDETTDPVAGVNASRTSLETQFNDLLTQIDQLASDAGYNGVNLLDGDDLSVIFNEDGSSSLAISGVDFDSAGLGITTLTANDFQTDTGIDAALTELSAAIDTLRSQASTFGSNLSVVEVRQDFTKSLINTLETGAANLTLADTNEEGANLLALQTRQQLSSVALSLASQSDQNVLRLF